jgi:hypothetical protein
MDTEALRSFVLEQLARDEQTARAMPHAIEGLQARWSPSKLIADCQAKRRIVEEIVPAIDSMDDQIEGEWGHGGAGPHEDSRRLLSLLALPYAHLKGYDEGWRP